MCHVFYYACHLNPVGHTFCVCVCVCVCAGHDARQGLGSGGGGEREREREKIMAFRTSQILHVGARRV